MQDDGPDCVPKCAPVSGDREADVTTLPAIVAATPESTASRTDTPLVPAHAYPPRRSRATLTLLTGMHAGRPVPVDLAGVIVGRAADADLVVDDATVSRRHARVARTSDGCFFVEDLGSTNGTFVGSARIGVSLLRPGGVVQLGPYLRIGFAMVDRVEESLFRRLYDSSVLDPLTHLFNRRYLADRLVAEVAHARRTRGELALLMADVDCLKQVNDRFGHAAGDRALCIVGARMKRAIRVEDVLARYGGDEFVIVAPGTGGVEALYLAERVRRAIGQLQMSASGQSVRLTLSIGIASLDEVKSTDGHIAHLLALADARLYNAKMAGRNCVRASIPSA